MSRVRKHERLAQQKKDRQKKVLITLAVIAGAILLAIILFMPSQTKKEDTIQITPDANGDLRISTNRLQDRINYINYGGPEELMVWKADENTIRTAFDTCEECYPSGDVHFTLSNESIICNVCGNKQPIFVLGTAEWGGCKPVSITPDKREDTDTEVVIPAAALAYAENMFLQWDASDFSISFEAYEAP